MPVLFGVSVTSATYDAETQRLTVEGTAFGENQYPVSNIEVSPNGVDWTAANTIVSWGDTEVVGEFDDALSDGTYDVRVTSSDDEAATLEDAFTVGGSASTATAAQSRTAIAIGIGIGF